MKILLAGLYYFPVVGGVETSLKYLAKKLQQMGHEVEILCFDSSAKLPKYEILEDVIIHRVQFKSSIISYVTHRNISTSAFKAINNIIYNVNPDQIWSRNVIVSYGLNKSKYISSIKHIFSTTSKLNIDGLYKIDNPSLLKRFLIKTLSLIDYYSLHKLEKNILRSEKVIPFVFSKMMKQQIEDQYNTLKSINLVYPGVDREIFNHKNDSSCGQFGKFFLYVGRLSPAKNVDILIEAFLHVQDVNLVIVGDGPSKTSLQEKTAFFNLQNRVFYLGTQKDILPSLYSAACATILPTKIETFGQVLIESLACGTPVIGFGNNLDIRTATSEIVRNEYNGIVVNEYSPIKLSQAMNIIKNKDEKWRFEAVEYNQKYVETNFSWNVCAESILNIN